jgi:hypothetical protein
MSDTYPDQSAAASSAGAANIHSRMVDSGQGWVWVRQAWDLFAKNPGIWMLNVFLLIVISVVCGVVIFIGWIAYCVLIPVLMGGLMLGCRALDRGEEFNVGHLFAGFSKGSSQLMTLGLVVLAMMIAISIIMCIVIFVGGGGTALAALAGGVQAAVAAIASMFLVFMLGLAISLLAVIPISMALWFAPCLIVFRGVAAVDAMRLSFNACLKNIVPFLIYGLVTFVIFILISTVPHIIPVLGSIASFLLSLVFWAVIYASAYTGYRDIFPEG